MGMFHERLDQPLEIPVTVTAEEAIRAKMRRLIKVVNCSTRYKENLASY